MSEITGYIEVPFHGESAYEIAVRYGYNGTEEEWIESIGSIDEAEMKKIMDSFADRLCGYVWYADTDAVFDSEDNSCGSLSDCMTEDFVGSWFYVRTSASEAGTTAYSDKYAIDGANGYLSIRDYVVWTGVHLVHIPTFEAKASQKKNSDGKYSPKSGVDGLMSSTDKAYLTDLIESYWGKTMLPVYTSNVHECNKLLSDGVYVGGFLTDCAGHPPYMGGNTTNWVMVVFNNYANGTNPNNHRVQIAIDLSNHLVYFRKGWISSGGWADTWTDMNPKIQETVDDSQVIFAENTATVYLTENTREIVATGDVNLKILLPEKTWLFWRCILNFSNADSIESIDLGTSGGEMFGIDFDWSAVASGRTCMLVKQATGQLESPSLYSVYEVDNLTRQMV